jgi:hypothetical protein
LMAFLANVSLKFNLIDLATEDSVARRHWVWLPGEGGFVQPGEGVKRSTFRCSMVVVVFLWKCGCWQLLEAVGQKDITSTRISSLRWNFVGLWVWPQFHAADLGSLCGIKGFVRPTDDKYREWS